MNTSIHLFNKLLSILLFSFLISNSVMANTGKAFSVKGTAAINYIELNSGDTIKQGDIIKTAANSSVQILMKDKTVLSIGENTRFEIKQYSFNAEKPAESKAHFSLLKGTLRYISGLLAKSNPDNIKVTAGTATIGIRGTKFSVVLTEHGTLTITLVDGKIQISSANGTIELTPGSKLEGTLKDIENGTATKSSLTPAELKDLNLLFNNLAAVANAGFLEDFIFGAESTGTVVGGGGGDTGDAISN